MEAASVAEPVVVDYGCVDVLVNNARINRNKTIETLEGTDWDTVFNINLQSMYILWEKFWSVCKAHKFGVIIKRFSMMGRAGSAGVLPNAPVNRPLILLLVASQRMARASGS